LILYLRVTFKKKRKTRALAAPIASARQAPAAPSQISRVHAAHVGHPLHPNPEIHHRNNDVRLTRCLCEPRAQNPHARAVPRAFVPMPTLAPETSTVRPCRLRFDDRYALSRTQRRAYTPVKIKQREVVRMVTQRRMGV